MVGRLQVVLLSIVPTSAALVYLLWMYRWKKPRHSGGQHAQKVPPAKEKSHPECERTPSKADSTVVPDGTHAVAFMCNEDYGAVESHSISVHVNVDLSPGSNCAQEKTLYGDEQVSETSFASDGHLIDDNDRVGEFSADISREVVSEVNTCQSVNASATGEANSINCECELECEDGAAERAVIEPRQNGTATPVNQETCRDTCIVNNNVDVDKTISNNGCAENNEPTEVYVNGRRDSVGSISDGNSCDSHDTNANSHVNLQNEIVMNDEEKAVTTHHSFDFPAELCGRLIGQRGRNVGVIKEKSGAEIYVRAKQYNTTWQVITLEGTFRQVHKALEMIKKKFPAKRFPGIDYDRCLPDTPILPADVMQLCLPTGVPVEVIVCSVVAANHVFLQQPTHPTFPSLERQNYHMRMCYSVENVPHLPRPVEAGVICAAPVFDDWCRAQVVQSYHDTDEYDVKLVDYGGYLHVLGTSLRQIRSDFMSVPFQAIECYMSSVIPPADDDDFPPTASKELEELVSGCILHCEVTAVEEDGVPYVMLTKVSGSEATVVNRELVHRGLARWFEM